MYKLVNKKSKAKKGNTYRTNSVKEKQDAFIQIKISKSLKAKFVKAAGREKLGTWIKRHIDRIADEELAKRNIKWLNDE